MNCIFLDYLNKFIPNHYGVIKDIDELQLKLCESMFHKFVSGESLQYSYHLSHMRTEYRLGVDKVEKPDRQEGCNRYLILMP